jgi:HEAT repeat protein
VHEGNRLARIPCILSIKIKNGTSDKGSKVSGRTLPAVQENESMLPHDDELTIDELVDRLRDYEVSVRLHAAACLGAMRKRARPAVPALIDALHDVDAHVRKMAATVLGDMGMAARAAVPGLIQALRDDNAGVRRRAAVALSDMGAEAAGAVAPLRHAMQNDPHEGVRRAATLALQEIEPTLDNRLAA